MTEIKEVYMGEDIKRNLDKNPCAYNKSNIDVSLLDNDELYLVTRHIGYHDKFKRSGIFVLDIIHLTEEVLKTML